MFTLKCNTCGAKVNLSVKNNCLAIDDEFNFEENGKINITVCNFDADLAIICNNCGAGITEDEGYFEK